MSDPTIDNAPYFPGVPLQADRKELATAINNILTGSLNVTRNVQVTTSPVTIQDPRIHPFSFILPMGIGTGVPPFRVKAVRMGEVDLEWTGAGPWNVRMLIIG